MTTDHQSPADPVRPTDAHTPDGTNPVHELRAAGWTVQGWADRDPDDVFGTALSAWLYRTAQEADQAASPYDLPEALAMGRLINCSPSATDPASEPAPIRTGSPAYDAVYAYIRALGDYMPPDPVHRNALIWRAVQLTRAGDVGRLEIAVRANQTAAVEAVERAEQAEGLLRVAHETSNRSEAARALAVQRAEEAEAQLSLIDAMRQNNLDAAGAAIQRAEQAEAAITRVRAQCAEWARPIKSGSWDAQIRDDIAASCADMVLYALDTPAPATGQEAH